MYSTLAPHTHLGQTLCLPAVCLWVIWSGVALSVKNSAKGSILSVLYSGIYLWSLNCGSKDIEVKVLWLPADPDFYICGASSLVFFDLDIKLEVVISIWLVMREDQLAVWHGTPLCNVITEDAKSMGFIWQTWCDVESAQSTFYRQFSVKLFDSTYLWPSSVAVCPKQDSDSFPKTEWFNLIYQKVCSIWLDFTSACKRLKQAPAAYDPTLPAAKRLSCVSLIHTFHDEIEISQLHIPRAVCLRLPAQQNIYMDTFGKTKHNHNVVSHNAVFGSRVIEFVVRVESEVFLLCYSFTHFHHKVEIRRILVFTACCQFIYVILLTYLDGIRQVQKTLPQLWCFAFPKHVYLSYRL